MRKVLVSDKGKRYLYRGKDLHTKEGLIKKEDIDNSSLVESNKGVKFRVFDAGFYDSYKKIKRVPQILTPKDLGYVMVRTGLTKDSVVVEAGGGSGAVSCYLGKIVSKVYVYENKEKHVEVIRENLRDLDVENVELFEEDVKGFKHENVDLLFLDLPDPVEVLESDFSGLKSGGFVVCYLPSVNQVSELCEFCRRSECFVLEETSELLKREWIIEGRRQRPASQMMGHTAFLVFMRFVK